MILSFRFLFILLGPVGKAQQYHEIGRSMATIMTDEVNTSLFFTVPVDKMKNYAKATSFNGMVNSKKHQNQIVYS